MPDPTIPTKAQAKAERRLREMGATMTVTSPHGHSSPVPGCYACAMQESAKRVNGHA